MAISPKRNKLKFCVFYGGILIALCSVWIIWVGVVTNPFIDRAWQYQLRSCLVPEEELYSKLVNIHFEDEPLDRALDSMFAQLNKGKPGYKKWRYSIDSSNAEMESSPVTMRLSNIPFAEALREVSSLTLTRFEVKGRRNVVIRSVDAPREGFSKSQQLTEKLQRLCRFKNKRVSTTSASSSAVTDCAIRFWI